MGSVVEHFRPAVAGPLRPDRDVVLIGGDLGSLGVASSKNFFFPDSWGGGGRARGIASGGDRHHRLGFP